jgi:hypothetical protein
MRRSSHLEFNFQVMRVYVGSALRRSRKMRRQDSEIRVEKGL